MDEGTHGDVVGVHEGERRRRCEQRYLADGSYDGHLRTALLTGCVQLPDFIRSFDGDFNKHDDQGNGTMCFSAGVTWLTHCSCLADHHRPVCGMGKKKSSHCVNFCTTPRHMRYTTTSTVDSTNTDCM